MNKWIHRTCNERSIVRKMVAALFLAVNIEVALGKDVASN